MANEKLNGSQIFLRKVVGELEANIVCEQSSEFSISVEGVTVQCKTTGEFVEQLAGGTKSGSISFSGAYVQDPTVNTLSFKELYASLGEIGDWIWGGTEVGQMIIETKAKLSSLSITSSTNEAVTFSMTLDLSEAPVITEIGT